VQKRGKSLSRQILRHSGRRGSFLRFNQTSRSATLYNQYRETSMPKRQAPGDATLRLGSHR
jgi:hypothetical protein